MPVSCCAVGCANRYSKESNVTFHRFPEDSTRRQRWINAVSRDKWILKDHHRLCSDHSYRVNLQKTPKTLTTYPQYFVMAREDPTSPKIQNEPNEPNEP